MSEEKKEFELTEAEELEEELEEDGEEQESERLENIVYDWARSLLSAVVAVVLLFTFCIRMIGVSGGSMMNTLYDGDRLIMLNSMFCEYEQGDIVILNAYNALLSETIIKRVVAVGGQTVNIDFNVGIVYVDGVALDEPYVK